MFLVIRERLRWPSQNRLDSALAIQPHCLCRSRPQPPRRCPPSARHLFLLHSVCSGFQSDAVDGLQATPSSVPTLNSCHCPSLLMSDTAEVNRAPAAPNPVPGDGSPSPTNIGRYGHEPARIAQPSTFLLPRGQNLAMKDKPLSPVDKDQLAGLVSGP